MEAALQRLREGKCVAILDDEKREGETDLFFPAITVSPANMRTLRVEAGGELYIAVSNEMAQLFAIPYISQAFKRGGTSCNGTRSVDREAALSHEEAQALLLAGMQKSSDEMCQGSCSVGISLDHRSTHTGAPDNERSFTCRRLAELWEEFKTPGAQTEGSKADEKAVRQLGREFHTPGHIFLCIENSRGLEARKGHTELSVALAKLAGIPPIMVGCVMLCNTGDNFGALDPQAASEWAKTHDVPFLHGKDVIKAIA